MLRFWNYMIAFLFGVFFVPVTAGFCEGGHICSSPRECCTQGCCPPYQTGPRKLTPATDHVLNLFFISHWYFWCVVVAIVLAVLCAYSLWKKRRQLCGWGMSSEHAQSEGDSTGSCYAPPQYSRCNSFRHPPPPYTEVTSKPDLYPLVFTCNSDSNKSGGSYLMVQYFRNLIVRPVGSLSATSTVDSLSSSFICNANEANLLVPPPYSRAASPEIGIHSHFILPRSASQLVCQTECSQQQQSHHIRTTSANFCTNDNVSSCCNSVQQAPLINSEHQRGSDTNIHYFPSVSNRNKQSNSIITSHSDQQLKFITNNSNSDIFINNSEVLNDINTTNNNNNNNSSNQNDEERNNIIKTRHILQRNAAIYNSIGSIDGVAVPPADEYRNIVLRQSLETSCCQLMKQQKSKTLSFSTGGTTHSSVNTDLMKKYDGGGTQNYLNSNACSIVSSLANIDSPNSPPQATSPTSEIAYVSGEQASQPHTDNRLNDNIEIRDFNINKINFNKGGPTMQNKKKLFSKSNKSMYIPITNSTTNNTKSIKSPVATSFFVKNRGKRNYNSRSAPTTPGCVPSTSFLGDDSPLLNEYVYDEDAEFNA